MVGVHVIGILPAKRLYRLISFDPQTGRLCADEGVLAVGFVPDRDEDRAEHLRLNAGLELRARPCRPKRSPKPNENLSSRKEKWIP